MAASHARDELGELLQILEDDLLPALNNLPPPATIAITPQTRFPSEHPYKLCIGSHNTAKIWIILGARSTTHPSLAPTIKIYSGGSSDKSLAAHRFDQLDQVDMVQPFKKLWRKTRYDGVGNERTWADNRRGMLKGMVYLYFLNKAVERGGSLRVPDPIKKYIEMALRRLGATPYLGQRKVVQDKDEAAPLEVDAEPLRRQEKDQVNIVNGQMQQPEQAGTETAEESEDKISLKRKRADLKRRLMELDAEEVEMEQKNMEAKKARTEKSEGNRPLGDIAGWKSNRLLLRNQDGPLSHQNGPSAQALTSDTGECSKPNGQPSSKNKRRRIEEAGDDAANTGLLSGARKHPVSAAGSSAAASTLLNTFQPRQNASIPKRSPVYTSSCDETSSNADFEDGANVNIDNGEQSEYQPSNEGAPDDADALVVQDVSSSSSSSSSYGSYLGTINVAGSSTIPVALKSTGPVSLAKSPAVDNSHLTKPANPQGYTAGSDDQRFTFELPGDEWFDKLRAMFDVEAAKKSRLEAVEREREELRGEIAVQRMGIRQALFRMYGVGDASPDTQRSLFEFPDDDDFGKLRAMFNEATALTKRLEALEREREELRGEIAEQRMRIRQEVISIHGIDGAGGERADV